MRRFLAVVVLVLASPLTALTQTAATVLVRDDRGLPVAHAVVTLVGGVTQVADSSGSARFQVAKRDSVQFQVRRIGHREFKGWVRNEDAVFNVTLPATYRAIGAVVVTAERERTPLERTGFYDRVNRVQRGAFVGEFITPEELNARNAAEVSRLLDGRRAVRVRRFQGKPALTGRGGCAMTILVDGQQVRGTVEEHIVEDVPQSVFNNTQMAGPPSSKAPPNSIDDVVNGLSVMAIEIYPSTANAPAELQRLGGRGSCGIVAIWTGPRQ